MQYNQSQLLRDAAYAKQVLKRKKRESIIYSSPLDKYLDPNFPKQSLFISDRSQFIAAQCSRRAGKSNGLAIRFLHTLETHPGAFCPYVALTRESAKNIMWGVLQEQCDHFGIAAKFTESNLTMTHPNGARLQLFGADMKNFIKRLKGTKSPGVGVDEAQDYASHLRELIDDVLTPSITDYSDSWLALVGTPGPIPLGYFFEVTEKRLYNFNLHKWTLFENPYLPNARAFVEKIKKDRGWKEDHPTLRREWYNEWVLDLESLLIRYSAEKNHYDQLPAGSYTYILGIDVGYRDADALSILAWSDTSRNIYLVEEELNPGKDVTDLGNRIEKLRAKYNPAIMVIDEGGLGKKLAEELRRRKHLPLKAAEKQRKQENVALLNEWLSLGYFKAKFNSIFAQDSYKVQIDWDKTTPDRIVVKNSFHSDIIDAVLYAFKESPAFTYTKPLLKPKYGTKEWAEHEEKLMEEFEIELAEKEEAEAARDRVRFGG